jgi:hypothetical protein
MTTTRAAFMFLSKRLEDDGRPTRSNEVKRGCSRVAYSAKWRVKRWVPW